MNEVEEFFHAVLFRLALVLYLLRDALHAVVVMVLGWCALFAVRAFYILSDIPCSMEQKYKSE